jgi:DNA-binding transcriptional LysR family regulator
MNSGLSWDEFRLVKSIADARSLVGAAERLGVNHSTVFRRLAAVELAVGARLFERSRGGYEPTAAGEDMIALATTMAESIVDFERRVAGRDIRPTGELSVTVPGAVGLHFMPAIVAEFQAHNPGVTVELILSNQALDLSRRDADVAIRLTNDPPESLVGRRICTGRWGVYCRRERVAGLGAEVIASVAFIGFGDNVGPASGRRWIETNVRSGRIVAKANSAHCMLEMALKGLGAALLPCFLADSNPGLARVGYLLPELDAGLWLLTHADLRRSARVRAFMDFAGGELMKHRRAIEGEEPSGAD